MTKRKKGRNFDPAASLDELISRLEELPGCRTDGEPGSECQPVIDRVDAALTDFKRSLSALHRAEGDSSGAEVLLGELERVARRAVRTADEYGAPCAPQTEAGSSNAPAVRAAPHSDHGCPLTTSQGEVSNDP